MKLVVDIAQRYAKMRAHTAAHLLHTALGTIFSETKQAGSFVDEDYLRFDFVADRPLTSEELVTIQQQVNNFIYAALPVETIEASYDDAIKLGAKAFFEDKYGDVVRVVKVDQNVSTELCGGTHVTNTKDIGCFAILSQEAVASGIKRISAVVGPKVFEYVQEKDQILDSLAQKLGVSPKQVVDKTEKLLKEYEEERKKNTDLNKQLIKTQIEAETYVFESFDSVFKMPEELDLKTAAVLINDNVHYKNILICNCKGNYVILSGSSNAKNLADKFKLKGGGNERMYQGKDDRIKSIYLNAEKLDKDKSKVSILGSSSLSGFESKNNNSISFTSY